MRRSGQTTRIVDKCIQELFNKGQVFVLDHHDFGRSHEYCLKVLLRRISIEHPRTKVKIENKFLVKLIKEDATN